MEQEQVGEEEQTSQWLERRLVDHWPRLHAELQQHQQGCGGDVLLHAELKGGCTAPHAAATTADAEGEDEGSLAADDAKPQGGVDHAIASEDGRCELSDAQLARVVDVCFPLQRTGEADDKRQRSDTCVRRLAEWLFMDAGPHGCLAFLDVPPPAKAHAVRADDATKAQVFAALAPGVLLRMRKHNTGRAVLHQAKWTARQWDRIRLALRAATAIGSLGQDKWAATLIAPVLVSCLAFAGGAAANTQTQRLSSDQADILVAMLSPSGDPELAIAGTRLVRALDDLSVDCLPRAVKDALVWLIMESESARVRLAAVQCLAGSAQSMEPISLSILWRTAVEDSAPAVRAAAFATLAKTSEQDEEDFMMPAAIGGGRVSEVPEGADMLVLECLERETDMVVLFHARKPLESVLNGLPSDWEHSSRLAQALINYATVYRHSKHVPSLVVLASEFVGARWRTFAPLAAGRLPEELRIDLARRAAEMKQRMTRRKPHSSALIGCVTGKPAVQRALKDHAMRMLATANRWQHKDCALFVLQTLSERNIALGYPVWLHALQLAMECLSGPPKRYPARLRVTCQMIISNLSMVPVSKIDAPLMLDLCRLVEHSNQYTSKAASMGLTTVIRNRLLLLPHDSEEELLRACWAQLAAGASSHSESRGRWEDIIRAWASMTLKHRLAQEGHSARYESVFLPNFIEAVPMLVAAPDHLGGLINNIGGELPGEVVQALARECMAALVAKKARSLLVMLAAIVKADKRGSLAWLFEQREPGLASILNAMLKLSKPSRHGLINLVHVEVVERLIVCYPDECMALLCDIMPTIIAGAATRLFETSGLFKFIGALAVQYTTLPDPSWARALSSHQRLVKRYLACRWLLLGLHHAPLVDPVGMTALIHHMSCAAVPKYEGAWSSEHTPARRLESLINVLTQAYHASSSSSSSSAEEASSPSSSSSKVWRQWSEEGGRMDTVKCLFLLSMMLCDDDAAALTTAQNVGNRAAVAARKTAASALVATMVASTAQADTDEREEMARSWAEMAKTRDHQAQQLVVNLIKHALDTKQQHQHHQEEEGKRHPLLVIASTHISIPH